MKNVSYELYENIIIIVIICSAGAGTQGTECALSETYIPSPNFSVLKLYINNHTLRNH